MAKPVPTTHTMAALRERQKKVGRRNLHGHPQHSQPYQDNIQIRRDNYLKTMRGHPAEEIDVQPKIPLNFPKQLFMQNGGRTGGGEREGDEIEDKEGEKEEKRRGRKRSKRRRWWKNFRHIPSL